MTKRDTAAKRTFIGFSYNWRAPLKKEETTIIALEDEVTIYFPFNSRVKDKNQQVDQYLEKLAERLKLSNEKITIVGHTDNVGEEVDNERLGMERAESIQNILLNRGISNERISIDSKGERQPATSNSTEEGRHRNRRTVLRIIK
jgi:outer membrane protein OmpA-like peptidoglycan-associated protein